ncbi:response regulator transcription factor [Aerococcaceae bacterium zg-ZJ1578]|uniref:response regulator transcription factor n=1 Tax=Aerococcaceae TaxID=186827 RepID=UPI0013BE4671|nr:MULTISPECIES: response regulator transcription factor [unclassified Facklamia]MBK0348488.1 response regulator transcription factor [Aerococcaceae bacterium zg-1578]MBR7927788.1 response regulator transcription factor [Aerococcaceae bacterium zg-ZUI334]MBS4462886.1 response regulator transcription factor [Aerococcaceae bacterium zg-B36]QQD65606.1 response regulator transcription factor [Aerococcaceae bacterium zg-252]NEW65009.1 response regulator [Facklamia sp. 252]
MATKILLVDDNREIVELLNIYLQNESYEVIKAYNGQQALNILENETVDLALLDIMMPQINGLDVLARLRASNKNVPVILVSAKSEDNDKIQGLVTGADDYITKPFNPLEVIARIKSLLRRQKQYMAPEKENQIEIGPLEIRKESHEVFTLSGKKIQLTALEFGILYLLASHPNRVFSADEIFEAVWNQESVVSVKTVMVHVSHLRDKIEAATDGEKVIKTVWGVGYKIEG